jgi:hypothetical protein
MLSRMGKTDDAAFKAVMCRGNPSSEPWAIGDLRLPSSDACPRLISAWSSMVAKNGLRSAGNEAGNGKVR